MAPALTVERRAAIARFIAQERAIRVSELATRFVASVATIRRDLAALEQQGLIQRVHGGAIAIEGIAAEQSASPPATPVAARIGKAVADMITAGETIFLGPGKLTLETAHHLATRPHLTVITNGLEVACWIASHTSHTLIVTGGQAEGNDMALTGPLTRDALASLRADRAILELGGVSAVDGLTDDSLSQAEIAQALLAAGIEMMVLSPVERVGRVAAAYIAPVSDVDVIVTAREAPSSVLWDLSEAGVRVVLA